MISEHILSIFHDAWLDRPSNVPSYRSPEEVSEADVILINHAHFDHGELAALETWEDTVIVHAENLLSSVVVFGC